MALFYSDKKAKKASKPTACSSVRIQSLDYQGLGVAKIAGKTWFVENGLPDEQVEIAILDEKRQFGRAKAVRWLQKSPDRQMPFCPHYEQCGGCQMQHIPLDLQRQTKQSALIRRLQKLQAEPFKIEPMLIGQDRGYRRRARLSIAWQHQRLVVGFRQAHSQQIVPLSHCEMLVSPLNALLAPLQQLLAKWRHPKRLGHLELVQADNTTVLLLRHLNALADEDQQALLDFAQQYSLSLFVMCDEEKIEHRWGEPPYYQIGELKLAFSVRDFIQVNADLNRQMVQTACDWLEISPQDRVLDLFCGMGNFSLPLAQQAGFVVGVEGVEPMVQQACQNAQTSGLNNVAFYQTNLDEPFADKPWAAEKFNKVLLDPARNGAYFALDHLVALQPERILYVSCNPATLVRDLEKLRQAGYRLRQCAMIDMFPHTGHLESISLLVK